MKPNPQKAIKRITALGAALVMTASSLGNGLPNAEAVGTSAPIVSEKQVITKACELLGVPYKLGGNGSTNLARGETMHREEFEDYGIDCSGFVYWTYSSLGVSVQHTDSANEKLNDYSMPPNTYCWHIGYSAFDDLVVSVGELSADVVIERDQGHSYDKEYYIADNGGYISPGSVVVMMTEDPMDEHAWMYIGYAEGGKQGIKDLLSRKYGITGISDTDIMYYSKEGNHWRIESTLKPRFLGNNVQFYYGGRISVVTPIYKTGVVISNRKTSAGGTCTGTVVFKLAGIAGEKRENDDSSK